MTRHIAYRQVAPEGVRHWLLLLDISTPQASRPSCSLGRMSKAALVRLVKSLARDLGPRGFTINNVQPGPVDTDLNPAERDFAESLKKLTALPRYASSDEIAAMVEYLAGPEPGFVTGASLAATADSLPSRTISLACATATIEHDRR